MLGYGVSSRYSAIVSPFTSATRTSSGLIARSNMRWTAWRLKLLASQSMSGLADSLRRELREVGAPTPATGAGVAGHTLTDAIPRARKPLALQWERPSLPALPQWFPWSGAPPAP